MRRILLIFSTLVVVAVAFIAYVALQTPPPKGGVTFQPTEAPPPPNSSTDDGQTLHAGKSVFMKSYDSKTHQLSNQFRADTYDPKGDGTVDMTNPEADFFLGGGQMLTINGDSGNVVDPNSAGGHVQGQSQTPSRGKMQHVILKLFKAVNDTVPQFTCWVNNLAFDNDSTTIVTEDCDIPDGQGNPVHTTADQVPVHVIGIDYDFDGRGLLIKWNERDRHLERLEIAHGEQLVIKHPNTMGSESKPQSKSRPKPVMQPISMRTIQPLTDMDGPIALVSTAAEDAASAAASAESIPTEKPPATQPKKRKKKRPTSKPVLPPTSAPVIRRAKDPGVYRATFFDNVHVTEADQTLATADRMNADFFMNNGHTSTQPSTRETTGVPAADSAADTNPVASDLIPAPVAAVDGALTNDTTPSQSSPKLGRTAASSEEGSTTGPTTQPDVPIIVRWTGKLIVTPPDADVPPLAVGDSVLQMIGDAAPAVLTRTGSVIHCASFRYHTLDQSVELKNSPAFPIVTVFDANGTKVFAPAITYNGNTAIIPGPARAEFPVSASSSTGTIKPTTHPTAHPTTARADWTDSCTLVLQPGEHGDKQVTEALLDGDVHVDHPQVQLNADELDLGLDNLPRSNAKSSATQPSGSVATSGQLRSMDASGAVDCTLHDSQGKPERILAEHLTLTTKRDSTGSDVPSEVTADGSVHTFDPTQSLRTEHLIAELQPTAVAGGAENGAGPNGAATAPTSRPSGGDVQLRELTATKDVHFAATDGSFADSEYLHVQTLRPAAAGLPADQEIDLMGQPSNARVGDKENVLTGPIIHYNTATKLANVVGPGTIHGVQQAAIDAQHPAPTTRPIDVAWQKSFALDGIGNHVDIKGDVHTKSTSADGTVNTAVGDRVNAILVDAPPTTAPTTTVAAVVDAPTSAPSLLAKSAQTNFMKDKVVDTVTLLAKDDENVQLSSIARNQAGAIIHAMNLFATRAIYDKTHDKFIVPVPGRMLVRDYRSTAPTSGPSESSSGGMRGTSAFEWEKSLVYDQHDDQAVMTGDVQVAHEAPGAASYQMFADKITVDLDPNTHPATRPATSVASGPTSQPAANEEAMKVKRLVADGQVRLISQKLGFTAAQAIYDPVTQIMTATGSQREPAQLLDEQGLSTGTFDKLVYNTATDQVQITEFHGNMIK